MLERLQHSILVHILYWVILMILLSCFTVTVLIQMLKLIILDTELPVFTFLFFRIFRLAPLSAYINII